MPGLITYQYPIGFTTPHHVSLVASGSCANNVEYGLDVPLDTIYDLTLIAAITMLLNTAGKDEANKQTNEGLDVPIVLH